MALLCQPAEFQGTIALPGGLAVCGIDSGIRHAVTGATTAAVRVGAFMGYRVLADLAGLPRHAGRSRRGTCASTIRGGTATSPMCGRHVFASSTEATSPRRLTGDAFLDRYGGTTDPVTDVDPRATLRRADTDRASNLRARARHRVGQRSTGRLPTTGRRARVGSAS